MRGRVAMVVEETPPSWKVRSPGVKQAVCGW